MPQVDMSEKSTVKLFFADWRLSKNWEETTLFGGCEGREGGDVELLLTSKVRGFDPDRIARRIISSGVVDPLFVDEETI